MSRERADDRWQMADDPREIRCAVTNVNFTGQADDRGQRAKGALRMRVKLIAESSKQREHRAKGALRPGEIVSKFHPSTII